MPRDPKDYYDDFSKVYDNPRDRGYHLFLDELETDILKPYVTGKDVLEAGCGTGLVLERAALMAASAKGFDLSPGMLEFAKKRGLDVCQGDLVNIPFEDESFDTVYSFKVLAHVPPIEDALREIARVTRPGGYMLLEFYNPISMRGLLKRLKPATRINDTTHDEQVYTRYDTLQKAISYLPEGVSFEGVRGVRVFTPFAMMHDLPLLGSALRQAEFAASSGLLARLAGFQVMVARKGR